MSQSLCNFPPQPWCTTFLRSLGIPVSAARASSGWGFEDEPNPWIHVQVRRVLRASSGRGFGLEQSFGVASSVPQRDVSSAVPNPRLTLARIGLPDGFSLPPSRRPMQVSGPRYVTSGDPVLCSKQWLNGHSVSPPGHTSNPFDPTWPRSPLMRHTC